MRRQRDTDPSSHVVVVDDVDHDDEVVVIESAQQQPRRTASSVITINVISDDDDGDYDGQNDTAAAASSTSNATTATKSKSKALLVQPIFRPRNVNTTDWCTRRLSIVPDKPHLGCVLRGPCPPHLKVAAAAAFRTLMALKPQQRGSIVVPATGAVVEVPRTQQAVLRDYRFSGLVHEASKEPLPECVGELMRWANALLTEVPEVARAWLPVDDPETRRTVRRKLFFFRNGGGGGAGHAEDDDDASVTREILSWRFNSVLINWYQDGSEYIGPHADSEEQLHPNSPIFSLSLGAQRTFRVRDAKTRAIVQDYALRDGDVIIMAGAMQKNFLHEVPKQKTATMPRINITFRCFR